MNIIVIDDESEIRELMQRILTDAQHNVLTAENGFDGIELIKNNNIDLIITDLVMPKKEGIETILDVKKSHPEIRIIAMSAGARIGSDSYLENAKLLGADDVLKKPFFKKELLMTVNKILPHNSI